MRLPRPPCVVAYLALTPAAPSFTATLVAEGSALPYEAVVVQAQADHHPRRRRAPPIPATGMNCGSSRGDNPRCRWASAGRGGVTISLPAPTRLDPGVSVEQRGGSPTGQPHRPGGPWPPTAA